MGLIRQCRFFLNTGVEQSFIKQCKTQYFFFLCDSYKKKLPRGQLFRPYQQNNILATWTAGPTYPLSACLLTKILLQAHCCESAA